MHVYVHVRVSVHGELVCFLSSLCFVWLLFLFLFFVFLIVCYFTSMCVLALYLVSMVKHAEKRHN